jgi:hypothetical protein
VVFNCPARNESSIPNSHRNLARSEFRATRDGIHSGVVQAAEGRGSEPQRAARTRAHEAPDAIIAETLVRRARNLLPALRDRDAASTRSAGVDFAPETFGRMPALRESAAARIDLPPTLKLYHGTAGRGPA